MGVEWDIGCTKCKVHIWLGSQKPYKWEGFQIPVENLKRFLSLHANCKESHGNFLLINDGTAIVPWEEEETEHEWKEDILSRTYCFDSYSEEGLKCAHYDCQAKLSEDENIRKQNKNLRRGKFLWFCDDKCFQNFLDFQANERDNPIYDSFGDTIESSQLFEMGCTSCQQFVPIDHQENKLGTIRNYQYLAEFLCEHIGPNHALKFNMDDKYAPWKDARTKNNWEEFVE
ncbi:MAG: hypothetical protein MI810_18300 [Flavobacteriales bacterium]|nr:hypothetical protein [Flavobacteriales bacterium]